MKRVSLLFGFWLCFLIAAQPAVASNPAIVGEISGGGDQNVFALTEHLGKHLQSQGVMGPKSWSLGKFLRWVPFGLVI